MWFDGQRQPNTIYVADTSRGKDSTAMLRAIQLMGWPLDMICSVDVWFDEETPAELPPMVAFKEDYDRKVLEWFSVPVTRLCATKRDKEPRDKESYIAGFRTSICSTTSHKESIRGTSTDSPKQSGRGARNSNTKKLTYCDIFYRQIVPKRERERERERAAAPTDSHRSKGTGATISNAPSSRIPESLVFMVQRGTQAGGNSQGFSAEKGSTALSTTPQNEGQKINIVHYIGIAADEPLRIAKHLPKKDKVLPLVQIGWDEDLCGLEAKYMDMLSPTYTDGQMRDGCWFCHNQGVNQLRRLRKMYPDLWAKLMKLDLDSPVTFHADGHTVHDFDRRFALEDDGLVDPAEPWKWAKLDEELNYRWF